MRLLPAMQHRSIGIALLVVGMISILPLYAQDNFPTHNRVASPKRIVSLGPALTEELYILGVGDRLVGNTIYCKRPPDAQKKEKVGTIIKINIETIVSLRPDLVLAISLTDVKAKEKLKSLGIRVVSFPYEKSFSELCRDFEMLGEIVGREKEAHAIIAEAKDKVEFIRKKASVLSRSKVFIQIGARPLHTATKDSFLNDFIEMAGGTNIASNARSGLYSRETVLRYDPDVIIIATMGIAGEGEKKNWERFKALKAVRDSRIYIIDSYKFCSPTPVSFVKGLEEMFEILHPQNEPR